jgi:RimJ/RimL family protein N-acetyltransferase
LQINCLGVINQDIKGKIWVDDVINPKTAMLIDNIWVIYLLGDPNNRQFNIQAGKIIKEYIFPNQLADKEVHREWIIDFFSEEWKSKIDEELNLTNWFEVELWHYKLEELKLLEWKNQIQAGYELVQVDEEFLMKTYLKNHSSITSWIFRRWKNNEDFFKRGFCFCLIKEDKEIVSWAMSDWSTENYIVMGINTDENYQRRGFASIVTAAAAEYCKSKDIDLRWFCSSQNIGSWKTAEKIGFQKIKEQTIIIGEFS